MTTKTLCLVEFTRSLGDEALYTGIDENMDSVHKWQLPAGMVLEELKKKEWRKVLKNKCGGRNVVGL